MNIVYGQIIKSVDSIFKFIILLFLNILFFRRPMINLVVLNVQHQRKWNPCSQFGMLHGLIIHFEPFHVRKKQFWPLFNHNLFSSYLRRITTFAHKFIILVK